MERVRYIMFTKKGERYSETKKEVIERTYCEY